MAVNDIFNIRSVGKRDTHQIPQKIIVVSRRLSRRSFRQQFAVGGVCISVGAITNQPVLIIIRSAIAIAVGVIRILLNDRAVFDDLRQPVRGVIRDTRRNIIFIRKVSLSLLPNR